MTIKLRSYQEEAVKLAVRVSRCMLLMDTGSGKTVVSMFLSRILLKRKLIDKILIACTVNAVNVFKKDFSKKAGMTVGIISNVDELEEFLNGEEKIALFKHSFITEIGFNQENIDRLENTLTKNYKKVAIIIDEAHELNNPDSKGHMAFDNIRSFFERIILLTATPYSSKLEQIFGLVHLIYPTLWKNVKEFKRLFVQEKEIRDWKTKRFKYYEPQAYINLPLLRKTLEPFTFFYFPKINLNYIYHTVRLKSYDDYDDLCRGVLTDKEIEEIKKIKEPKNE